MSDRPILHTVLYGDSGAKKSTMAASYPKPMLVWMFDPFGKELPYIRRGSRRDGGLDGQGTPITEVVSKKTSDQVLIRIEHYLDADFRKPDAFARMQARLAAFDQEYGQWSTVVLDSATFAELTARKWHQYGLNPTARDPRQWWGGSTDLLEEILLGRMASLPMNVVVIAHVDEDKDEMHGTFVRSPKLPGRLRRGVTAGYSEMYHLGVQRDAKGDATWTAQTTSDNLWNCASQINAPNMCEPDYRALWTNWDAETGG